MGLQKKITMYELYSVSRDENDKVISQLEDIFMEMEEAVKEAHVLMAANATATKIVPKQFSMVRH